MLVRSVGADVIAAAAMIGGVRCATTRRGAIDKRHAAAVHEQTMHAVVAVTEDTTASLALVQQPGFIAVSDAARVRG